MLDAAEIIKDKFPNAEYNDWLKPVIECMEQYAEQFRSEQKKVIENAFKAGQRRQLEYDKAEDKNKKLENPSLGEYINQLKTKIKMDNIDAIQSILKKEFEYTGDEQISGFTALKIINNVFEQFKSQGQKQVPTDEETAIMFLDHIRAYERENGERICFDERSSIELFDEFKSALQNK